MQFMFRMYLVFGVLVISWKVHAGDVHEFGMLSEKPFITASSLRFAAHSSVTRIYSPLLAHNMRTKNKSIKVCLFDVSLHAPTTSFKIVTCKDVVDWFDKTETVGVPVVGLSFPMAKIVDPGKFAPVVKKRGCGKLASFKLGMLCFVDDYVYLIGDGADKDSYSIDIRRALGLKNEVIPTDASDLWGALDAEISDDGKKIYFFRTPHSDWYDELKSIKNNQYFEYSLETGAVNVFFAPVNDSRDFIESIHEADGKRIILVSKTDKSGKKIAQYLLGFSKVVFSDYQMVRDYSVAANGVFTVNLLQEDGRRSFVLEEMSLDGKVKKTDLKWIPF